MNLFKLVLLTTFLCFWQQSEGQGFVCHYRDTVLKFDTYTVELKNTYCRRGFFTRTSAVIENLTDKYLIFNTKDVFISGNSSKEKPSLYNQVLVVSPHSKKKFSLKFKASIFGSPKVNFNFTKMQINDSVKFTFEPFELKPVDPGITYKTKPLIAKIISHDVTAKDYYVRLRVYYKGKNFLVLNIKNVAITSADHKTCHNHFSKKGTDYYNSNRPDQDFRLLFSLDCFNNKAKQRKILFSDVFTEYSLRTIGSFKITQSIYRH